MLGNFEYESIFHTSNLECVEDGGDLALELDINDGTNDLK